MKLKSNIFCYLVLIIIPALFSFSPESEKSLNIIEHNNKKYISLYDFSNTLDVHSSFDIITGRGKLFYKGAIAVYQTGFSAVLINGRLIKTEYPVARLDGEILIPIKAIAEITDEFYSNIIIIEKHDKLFIKNKQEVNKNAYQQIDKKAETGFNLNLHKNDRISFIIIDPGHGGKDPGAIGKGGIKEKWITVKIAAHLEEYLKTNLKKIQIKTTRKSDRFIELAERTQIANRMLRRNENGIFVSIHVNASILSSISGFETYFLSQNPSNDEARATAALENNVIILEENSMRKHYEDVEHVEAIMLTTQIQKESSVLARCVQSYMEKEIRNSNSKGVKNADFFVLRGSLMPAALVEVGYISNIKEAKKLKNNTYHKKLAKGIGDGILQFIIEYNKNIKQ